MAKLVVVEEKIENEKTSDTKSCQELEAGNILFFPKIPFPFLQEDIDFLLTQRQKGSPNSKNIAYKPNLDRITNFKNKSLKEEERLHQIMKNYSNSVVQLLSSLLKPYASSWKLDYTSFRPFQEKGRKLRCRARNDLLHTDAFPSRPMHGSRILRFFTNINPSESRKWITSHSFKELAEKYAGSKELPFHKPVYDSLTQLLLRKTKKEMNQMGLPLTLRSPYDAFILRLHNFLKENKSLPKRLSQRALGVRSPLLLDGFHRSHNPCRPGRSVCPRTGHHCTKVLSPKTRKCSHQHSRTFNANSYGRSHIYFLETLQVLSRQNNR